MKLSTRVARNTIIQILGKAASTVLGLFAIGLITRQLGEFGFGEYTTIITFISFFAIVGDLGLTLVTAQMISKKNADEDRILSNLFTLRLLSALAFLGAAPLAAYFFPYGEAVKFGIVLSVLIFIFPALNQILVGLFQKHLCMEKVAIAEVVGRAVLLIGIILSNHPGYGLNGILSVSIIAGFFNFYALWLFAGKLAKIRPAYDLAIYREIISRSWPIAVTITFNLLYLKTDTLILSVLKSMNEVGIYGAAYKIIEVLGTVPFMFAGIILPILTMAWTAGKKDEYAQVLQRSLDLMIILALPLMVGTQFVAEKVVVLVAGPEFSESALALKILVLAAGSLFIGCIPAHAVIAIDRQKKIISAYIFTAVTSVIGYLVFIPPYSYVGAAWMTVYSETVIALFSFYVIWKHSAFRLKPAVLAKTILASLAMGAYLAFWGGPLVADLVFGSLIYFTALYLLKGITKQDILDVVKGA